MAMQRVLVRWRQSCAAVGFLEFDLARHTVDDWLTLAGPIVGGSVRDGCADLQHVFVLIGWFVTVRDGHRERRQNGHATLLHIDRGTPPRQEYLDPSHAYPALRGPVWDRAIVLDNVGRDARPSLQALFEPPDVQSCDGLGGCCATVTLVVLCCCLRFRCHDLARMHDVLREVFHGWRSDSAYDPGRHAARLRQIYAWQSDLERASEPWVELGLHHVNLGVCGVLDAVSGEPCARPPCGRETSWTLCADHLRELLGTANDRPCDHSDPPLGPVAALFPLCPALPPAWWSNPRRPPPPVRMTTYVDLRLHRGRSNPVPAPPRSGGLRVLRVRHDPEQTESDWIASLGTIDLKAYNGPTVVELTKERAWKLTDAIPMLRGWDSPLAVYVRNGGEGESNRLLLFRATLDEGTVGAGLLDVLGRACSQPDATGCLVRLWLRSLGWIHQLSLPPVTSTVELHIEAAGAKVVDEWLRRAAPEVTTPGVEVVVYAVCGTGQATVESRKYGQCTVHIIGDGWSALESDMADQWM